MDANLLAETYPTITIRNRRDIPTNLGYANGDSVTIPPMVTTTVPTKGMHQIPDHTLFELINPTIFQLIDDGIVVMGEDQ